jgi:hypothetical protein
MAATPARAVTAPSVATVAPVAMPDLVQRAVQEPPAWLAWVAQAAPVAPVA